MSEGGKRRPGLPRRGLAALVLAGSLAGPAAALEPPESGWERADRLGRIGFDVAILRPFEFVQLLVSAAVFVPSYPVSILFDGEEDVMEACITQPAEWVFERPLGDL